MSTQPPQHEPEPYPGSDPTQSGQRNNSVPISGNNWGRRTGPLGGRSQQAPADPPDLSRYSSIPRYDMATIAELVGVRPVTLWTWEQTLGVISADVNTSGSTSLRYSERDLIALIWLRDQIVAGVEPGAAAARLRAAIEAAGGQVTTPPSTPYTSSSMPSRPLNSRSLRGPTDTPSQPISRLGATRPIMDSLPPSQPISGAYPPSRPVGPGTGNYPNTGTASAPRDLRALTQPLLGAFGALDGVTTAHILDEAFMSRSVETTCMTLILPVMARVSELWIRKGAISPEGLFAINVFKARLFRLFDVLQEQRTAPVAFIAAGPGEAHEIEALTLALFWRRMGLRIVYFGQDINSQALLDEVRRHRPRIVAVTISTPARVKLLAPVARGIARLDQPRAHFCLMGSILMRHPELQRKAGGIFLGPDPGEATQQVRQVLRIGEGQG